MCNFIIPILLHTVREAIRDSGMEAACLDLEITENTIMQSQADTMDVLHGFKDMGVTLSLDDFGTGYSSLSYLKRFPFDALKIDRSFVQGIPDDADDVALTKAIIAMAHSLNLRVVAEGVEDIRQLDVLRACGCDEVQGFLFSRPVPATEFARLLRQADAMVSNALKVQ